MFHKLENTDDWLDQHPHEVVLYNSRDDLIDDIVAYFSEPQEVLKFPAKSYAVALIYATLLQRHFGVSFDQALSDPDLLAGNDKHFLPYGEHTAAIYDGALFRLKNKSNFRLEDEDQVQLPQVKATIDYFKREFYLVPNPYFI